MSEKISLFFTYFLHKDTIKGNGTIVSKYTPISLHEKINTLNLSNKAHVTIYYDDKKCYIETKTDENIIKNAIPTIKGKTLFLRVDTTNNYLPTKLTYNIYVPKKKFNLIENITASGSSTLHVTGNNWNPSNGYLDVSGTSKINIPTITTNSLNINTSGCSQGIIKKILTTEKVCLQSSGTSKVTVNTVETGRFTIKASGCSNITIINGITKNTFLSLSGASTLKFIKKLIASGVIKINTSGSSKINLSKNTPVTSTKKSGASKVIFN